MVAAVLAILFGLLLRTVVFYQEQAELVAVRLVVSNVRAAIDIKVAEAKLPGRKVDFGRLAEQNPLDMLVEKPVNYAGEFFSPDAQEVEPGNWYFDRRDKVLVYLLNNGNSFGGTALKPLKFKVKLLRLPKNSAKPNGASELRGVAFEQVNG